MVKPLLLRHELDGSKAALRSTTIVHTVNVVFLEGGGGQRLTPFDPLQHFEHTFVTGIKSASRRDRVRVGQFRELKLLTRFLLYVFPSARVNG